MRCGSCGANAPDEARFCPSCGHTLVVRPDERRVATVLFADLVGFTTFSESADPEHVKNLVDRCFERLVADVAAFGGQVDKIVGDAIVALFGAPVAHEDDAERAVRAALQMQRTLATVRGRRLYGRRKTIVEPVFGQIKHARGFRQFLRRGLTRVQQEWALVCVSHNLLKLHAARVNA